MYGSYAELRSDLESGKITASEVVKYYLENIEKRKHLNAFVSVYRDEAILRANEIDEKLRKGTAGKLAGLVVAVKDVLTLKNKTLTCSSNILKNFISLYTATSVQRLIDEDAIIIGKTNCDEFAMGSSNENSAFCFVKNPIDETRVPGGSSGGSACAVAADMCMAALGTDTGGSVRQPASFCGIFGLKPTYGRISRYGLTAFASSFDTVGIFAKNSYDIANVLGVISGHDSLDSTCVRKSVPDYSAELKIPADAKNFKIGILEEFLSDGLDEEIKSVFMQKINRLRDKGFQIENLHLPHCRYSIQTYYILTTAEASSNLARYDGARYGIRSAFSETVEDMYVNSRSEGFGNEVKRRIMLGTYVLSAGYYDAYYKKAQQVRRLIKNDFENAFKKTDVILSPTTPTTAFKIGEKIDDPLAMYLNDVYTTSANLAAVPAISIPFGFDSKGLPVGLQIIANDFEEAKVLKMSDYIIRNL